MTLFQPAAPDRLVARIDELRRRRNAVILAHNYQTAEVQDIADIVGDSLALAQRAADVHEAQTIVLCGVRFMAETAKLVNPSRTVLMPDENAGCPMANMITPRQLADARQRHPDAAVVCYVNSSAAVKAASDICCTSGNALRIVASIPEDRPVLFVPDQSLGDYVARQLGRDLILWPGYCPTHHRILPEHIDARRREHPDALVLVHPECTEPVRRMADFVGSTAQIIDHVRRSDSQTFIIGTEMGICHTLAKQNPGKTIVHVTPLADCPNMKLTTLEKILWSLEEMQTPVEVPDDVADGARRAIQRMLDLS
jgi:quinolinate synthase